MDVSVSLTTNADNCVNFKILPSYVCLNTLRMQNFSFPCSRRFSTSSQTVDFVYSLAGTSIWMSLFSFINGLL